MVSGWWHMSWRSEFVCCDIATKNAYMSTIYEELFAAMLCVPVRVLARTCFVGQVLAKRSGSWCLKCPKMMSTFGICSLKRPFICHASRVFANTLPAPNRDLECKVTEHMNLPDEVLIFVEQKVMQASKWLQHGGKLDSNSYWGMIRNKHEDKITKYLLWVEIELSSN